MTSNDHHDDDDDDDEHDDDDDDDDDDDAGGVGEFFLTLGGLGVVALRLGPEEGASQDDLPVTACRRMDRTLCIPVRFPWFRTGRRVR